jgi:hypothetical protein
MLSPALVISITCHFVRRRVDQLTKFLSLSQSCRFLVEEPPPRRSSYMLSILTGRGLKTHDLLRSRALDVRSLQSPEDPRDPRFSSRHAHRRRATRVDLRTRRGFCREERRDVKSEWLLRRGGRDASTLQRSAAAQTDHRKRLSG